MSVFYRVATTDEVGDQAVAWSKFPTKADDGERELRFVVIRNGTARIGYFPDRTVAGCIAALLNACEEQEVYEQPLVAEAVTA